MIYRTRLSRDLVMKCWDTAVARLAIKLPHTNHQVSSRDGIELHFEGLMVEAALGEELGRPDLVDFSVKLTGDDGNDMRLGGKTIQIKANTYTNPTYLRFDIEGKHVFKSDIAVLGFVTRSPPEMSDAWCAEFGWVELLGWISREEFFQRAEVRNFGHGDRLVVAPPLNAIDGLSGLTQTGGGGARTAAADPRQPVRLTEGNMQDVLEIHNLLAAPFPHEYVEWRVGPTNEKSRKPDDPLRGQALCYVDARTVMDRLDSICGIDGWQCSYSSGVGSSIVCNIAVRLAGDWVWKADGAGPSDMEADKGALSDAFKRAAVRWGVGRYLYDIETPWLALDKRGNTAFIPKNEYDKLNQLHDEFARKAGWGSADGVAAYRLLLADLKRMPAEARREFVHANAPLVEQMSPGMRKHLLQASAA